MKYKKKIGIRGRKSFLRYDVHASLNVVTSPITSTSPHCRNMCKAYAESLPELHDSNAFGFILPPLG